MQVETIKVKAGDSFKIINVSDFDPKVDTPFDGEAKAQADRAAEADEATRKLAAERKAQANYGQVNGNAVNADGKNPSGTFSEPTPTDIRYPDKTATEFENNLGAFVGGSAAELRTAEGLPDAPGGLQPDVHEEVQAATEAAALQAAQVADEGKLPRDPLDHDTNGRKGGAVNLDEMTVAELKAYAEQRNIDLGDATRKDDIRAAIDLANGK